MPTVFKKNNQRKNKTKHTQKQKKTVPVPPAKNNHKKSRKYRDKDSKLPVEENAGIHSKKKKKIIHRRKLSVFSAPSTVPMQKAMA